MKKEITTRNRKEYMDKLNGKKPHYTVRNKRRSIIPMCILFMIIGMVIGITAYPFINNTQFTMADEPAAKIDLEDVPLDTIKQYVRDNKYMFPEFFPDVMNIVKDLKPTPAPTATPAPKVEKKNETATPSKDEQFNMKEDIRKFFIKYLKYYYNKFVGVQTYPLTKVGYIRNLESDRRDDRVYFSFSTPKVDSCFAILYPDGTVHWNSLSGCTQLDVEKALQIMIDNVRA